ncbi:MAG: hypothetical protein HY862_14465 [Chloroflexi bacterium]|nr:hypothetical protein [Chloroflexota bacterium]
MKTNFPLLRVVIVGLAVLLMLHLPGNALANCCSSANYYYIFTGFSGACVDDGSGNVVINGTFFRAAYLPANNVNNYAVTNPAFAGAFSLGAVGSESAGQNGSFLLNFSSAPSPAPTSVTVTATTQADGVSIGSSTTTVTCTAIGAVPVVNMSHTYTAMGGGVAGNIYDGRLNTDAGAPAIIYPGSIRVFAYDPINCISELALTITNDTIDAVGIPAENTVLGSATNPFTNRVITIYRLTTGEFQMNTRYADGKLYVFTWNEDATNRYHPDY